MGEVRLLLLDRNPNDRVFLERLLKPSIPSIRILQAVEISEVKDGLAANAFDIVIVDSSVGAFRASLAFREVHELMPHSALIYLSDAAVEAPIRWEGGPNISVFPRGDVERIVSIIKAHCLKQTPLEAERGVPVNQLWPSGADQIAAKATFDRSFEIISLVDAAGLLVNIRNSHMRPLGYDREEILNEQVFSLIHPKDLPRTRNAFKKILQKSDHTESVICRVKAKDGSWRWLETVGVNKLLDPALRSIVLNSRDITDRKLQERALTDAATALAHLEGSEFFEFSVSAIAQMLGVEIAAFTVLAPESHGASRTIAFWMDGALQPSTDFPLAGSPCEEAIHRKLCCYPRNVVRAFPNYEPLKQIRGEAYVGLPLQAPGGSVLGTVWVVSRREIKRTKMVKSVLQIFGVKAAMELQKKGPAAPQRVANADQELFRRIVELTDEVVLVAKPDWSIKYANPQAAAATGFTIEELCRKRLIDLVNAAQQDSLDAAFQVAFSGAPQTLELEFQGSGGRRSVYTTTIAFDPPVGLVLRARASSADRSIISDLRVKTTRQEALIKISEHLLSEPDFSLSLKRICSIAAAAVNADTSCIWEEGIDQNPLLIVSHGWPDDARNQPIVNSPADPISHTLANRITTIVNDYAFQERFLRPKPFTTMQIASSVSVPFSQATGKSGALCVQSRKAGNFLHLDVAFLESVARILTTAAQRPALDTSKT